MHTATARFHCQTVWPPNLNSQVVLLSSSNQGIYPKSQWPTLRQRYRACSRVVAWGGKPNSDHLERGALSRAEHYPKEPESWLLCLSFTRPLRTRMDSALALSVCSLKNLVKTKLSVRYSMCRVAIRMQKFLEGTTQVQTARTSPGKVQAVLSAYLARYLRCPSSVKPRRKTQAIPAPPRLIRAKSRSKRVSEQPGLALVRGISAPVSRVPVKVLAGGNLLGSKDGRSRTDRMDTV